MALIQFNFPKRKKKKIEFAKKIIGSTMIIYVLAALYGAVIVWIYPEYMGEWLTLVGLPVPAAIGFYCWKAKGENVEKIKANPDFLKQNDDEEAKG